MCLRSSRQHPAPSVGRLVHLRRIVASWCAIILPAIAILVALPTPAAGVDPFAVALYRRESPPPTPALADLPLVSTLTHHGITWTFAEPRRVGRFVNGDYYVVGTTTITNINPLPTSANGRHGSMLNIRPNAQRSGFDDRLEGARYDPSLRVYPPIVLTPGNKFISSRSAGATHLNCVLRPIDRSVSPVASVSILTCVDMPLPPDAFRPSYAAGSTNLYRSRDLRRSILPRLPPVAHVPPRAEFEGYFQRPWVDAVFFNFDVPAEYMASYGRENGYLMSFGGLLLTLDYSEEQKEPLLVYLVQYGIDLFGLVQQGHTGWQAHGGHGTGRKFPVLLAGLMLDHPGMLSVRARFGEDLQTAWITNTPPVGSFTQTWHTHPATVVYAGHVGLDGETVNAGWGPYEHLPPAQWKSTLGESYRRCCTSVSWVGQALAARLVPGLQDAWNHPPFFAYVDRWMQVPDDPADLDAIRSATGMTVDTDFRQGQAWRILSGGGYQVPHRTFIDEMWAAYRKRPRLRAEAVAPAWPFRFMVENATPNALHWLQTSALSPSTAWTTLNGHTPASDRFVFEDPRATPLPSSFYRVEVEP